MKQISKIFLTTLVISLGSTQIAQARTITSISPPTGPGLGDTACTQVQAIIDTPQPNNDDSATASPNQIADFPNPLSCSPISFKEIAPVDSVLQVEASEGTTEYYVKQTIVNNTDSPLEGFNFRIGFGTGDDFATPDVALFPTGVAIPTFDDTPAPTSSKFSEGILDGSFTINWSGGSIAPGESVDLTYSLDLPDDLSGLNLYDQFTIRQTPILQTVISPIPEPTTVLGLLTFAGLAGWSKSKKKSPPQL